MILTLKSLAGAACPLLLWHAGEFEGFSWFGGEDEKQLDKKAVESRSVMFQYPYHPCMVYLPTFTINFTQL